VLFIFLLNRRVGVVALTLYFLWSMILEHVSSIHVCGFYPINGLFLAGLLLGMVDRFRPAILVKVIPMLFFGLGMALLFIVYNISLRNWVIYLSAVSIVAGILGFEHFRPAHRMGWPQRTMQFLGTVSFSLYVGHTLTQSMLSYVVGTPTLATCALFVAVPVLVAFVSFLLIEKPSMTLARWLDGRVFSHAKNITPVETTELKLETAPERR
jgi:peptidoglycan/LPS O-acetylase OafA/YrhL